MGAKQLGNQLAYPTGYGDPGLTKRELFGAMAMWGLAANPDPQVSGWDGEKTANCAVRFADALLAELSKDQP